MPKRLKIMDGFRKTIVKLVIFLLFTGSASANTVPGKAVIATAHPLATHAGFEVLGMGGNAFDAAIAVSAALAVVEPAGSGLGGGGFWLLHRYEDSFEVMLDGREKAPLAARRDMYVDAENKVIKGLSKNGALAAAIPGMPAALVYLSDKYGRLSLSDALQPAIRYARDGFTIGERHRKLLGRRQAVLQTSKEAARIFLDSSGGIPLRNAVLKQSDLANTLEKLGLYGKSGFYSGEIARKLVKGVQAAGGIWTQKDLQQYQVVERAPIKGEYRGVRITSASLPSSGGIVLLESLNILAAYDLTAVDEVVRKHLIVEALRRAYHDRALYLGDPDFVEVPVKRLLNVDYAAGLRSTIRLDQALPSEYLTGNEMNSQTGRNTTHFSIIDQDGNRVSATLSINFPFGSGFMPPGTGVVLNNEMDDFSSQPGTLNGYGLIGGEANSIAPGKRMLSSMSPTFLDDGNRIAVLGTPGGSRIISMLLLAILDFAEGKGPESWVAVKRYHHQYIPDKIQYEIGGLNAAEIEGLGKLGHQFRRINYRYGNMQAVQWDRSQQALSGASDIRGEGVAEVRKPTPR
jgi:gamma-glutamyltranspeptidase / glutathione hydrolase